MISFCFLLFSTLALYYVIEYNSCQITSKSSQILHERMSIMRPLYENIENDLEIFHQDFYHISPHLHQSIECVYVLEGSLEIGIAHELYHMEPGDFSIVFPDQIHHYQVFSSGENNGLYLLASPVLSGGFLNTLSQYCPETPVIPADRLSPDIIQAMQSLKSSQDVQYLDILHQAYTQIILARALPELNLIKRDSYEYNDIVYQTVSYISKHFKDSVTLTSMASDLGISPYALSRVFSKTFHMNFSQYLNEIRLNYAKSLLLYTSQSITAVYENAGFESQRTFNRAFKEHFRMSPRDFRSQNLK